MELDKQFIVRGDFSSARRGYDPVEVDRHLEEIADAVEDLKRETRRAEPAEAPSTSSIAGAAADQVRAIVEAAERSAAEIEAGATEEADRVTGEATHLAEQERNTARGEAERLRREAEADARETRERAETEAARHLEGVREATAGMRERADQVEADLGGLVAQLQATLDSVVESVRTSAGSLEADLESIHAGLADARDAAPGDDDFADHGIAAGEPSETIDMVDTDQPTLAHDVEPGAQAEVEDGLDEDETDTSEQEAVAAEELPLDDGEQDVEPEEDDQPADDPEADAEVEAEADEEEEMDSGGSDSAEGARLIALNMALNGTPREETARYLEENFDLRDQDTILDEVYARVGG